jgi:hypothetical protein
VAEEFTCQVADERYRSACKDLPKYPDTPYCVLHYPGEEKNKEDFLKVVKSRLDRQDYDFRGAVFPEGTSDFEGFEFDADASFDGATFIGGAQFRDATFSKSTHFNVAQFRGEETNFRDAQFGGGRAFFEGAQFGSRVTFFEGAQFSGGLTVFSEAQFTGEEISFSGAEFGSVQTGFQKATFKGLVRFSEATFREKVTFWGTEENPVFDTQAWVWFHDSRIEKPELLTFNTVLLHAGWFINTDVRKVNFTDVQWYGMPDGIPGEPKGTLDEEIQALKDRDREIESPHTLLAQACRRLSANAEDNREYPLANEFHYWSMDALRKGSWSRLKGLTPRSLTKKETRRDIGEHFGLITTLYWALSGYGVRAARAFWVLMGMWAAFTTLYVLVDPSEFKDFGQGIGYRWQAAVYSLLAMARLNPEPRPEEPGLFQFLVGLEGILGPLQIALLALAVRRKVMR